jgi:hypothetical protein
MATRQATREALAALFTTTFNAVYAYAPLDLQGFTKVLGIYVDSTYYVRESQALRKGFHRFFLVVYVKRESGENTEDVLDACHEYLRTVIDANQSNVNWEHLSMEDASDAAFAEISGVPYRVETHPVVVKTII